MLEHALLISTWLPQAIIVVVGIASVSFVGFFVIFPSLLRKRDPTRPLTAYGRTLAGVLALSTVIVICTYWSQLNIWLWGIVAVGFISSALSLALFRSPGEPT
jgi:hypothetical protein